MCQKGSSGSICDMAASFGHEWQGGVKLALHDVELAVDSRQPTFRLDRVARSRCRAAPFWGDKCPLSGHAVRHGRGAHGPRRNTVRRFGANGSVNDHAGKHPRSRHLKRATRCSRASRGGVTPR
jgi:hypothetical protein